MPENVKYSIFVLTSKLVNVIPKSMDDTNTHSLFRYGYPNMAELCQSRYRNLFQYYTKQTQWYTLSCQVLVESAQ